MALERSRRPGGALIQGVRLLKMITMMVILLLACIEQASCVNAEEHAQEEVEEAVRASNKLAVIEMNIRNLYPESFDWDRKHNRFLVGSTSQGRLVTVTEEGNVEEFVKDEDYAGAAAILGVTVDSIHNRVLAVVQWLGVGVQDGRGPAMSALAVYDLDSKKRTLFVKLPDGERKDDEDMVKSKAVMPKDVAVDSDGNAYVTNSGGNSIWKVTPKGVASMFVEIPQLPMVAEDQLLKAITCNGVVHHDGHLLVAQTNSGALFTVRLADKAVQAVKIHQVGSVLPEASGIALRSDGSLVVVSSHTAWLLSSMNFWRSAYLVDKVPLNAADFTTGGAVKDLRVFTVHHHFLDKVKGLDRDTFKIVEIEFPADQHDNPLWLLLILGIFAVLVLAWRFQLNCFNKKYTKLSLKRV